MLNGMIAPYYIRKVSGNAADLLLDGRRLDGDIQFYPNP